MTSWPSAAAPRGISTRAASGAAEALWWAAAAALPLVAIGATAFAHAASSDGVMAMASDTRSLVRDAPLWLGVVLILVAPLSGVAAVQRVRVTRPLATGGLAAAAIGYRVVAFVAVFITASLLATLAVAGWPADVPWTVLATHSTLAAVGLALAAFGAACGTALADPLDAAACSLVTVVTAAAGLLVSGAWAFELPGPLLDLAVAANPLLTVASAAQIDLVRMPVPYQMSALAHVTFTSPAWTTACAMYSTVAGVCLIAVAGLFRARVVAAAR